MSKQTTPSQCDYVGSFLRPEALKQARADWSAGKISREELRKAEDAYITDLIEKQKALGYHVITDGKLRRSYWRLNFMWGLNGIEEIELDHGYYFRGEETTRSSCRMAGKISGENHPIIQDYPSVKQFENESTIAEQTPPAPAQTLAELFREDNARTTREFYLDEKELFRNLAAAYHRAYLDLYVTGYRNIQLDDCTWGMIVDEEGYWEIREGDSTTLEQETEHYLKINNLSLEDLSEDLIVNTHIYCDNHHSTYTSSGPYDRAAPYVFARGNVHAFYLEFDNKRSGSFVSLKKIPHGKKVVLGPTTNKRPELGSKELTKRRIYEATQYVSPRDLHSSPQCGFASCEISNKLTEEERFAKLCLIKGIAEEVWGEEEA